MRILRRRSKVWIYWINWKKKKKREEMSLKKLRHLPLLSKRKKKNPNLSLKKWKEVSPMSHMFSSLPIKLKLIRSFQTPSSTNS